MNSDFEISLDDEPSFTDDDLRELFKAKGIDPVTAPYFCLLAIQEKYALPSHAADDVLRNYVRSESSK